MLKAQSQPGILPSHSWFTADADLQAGAFPSPKIKAHSPSFMPSALRWVLRYCTELILISHLHSPSLLAILCHQSVTGVCRVLLACGQASCETCVIYGTEKVPGTCRAACAAEMRIFAKQTHFLMRKTSARRPGTQ